MNPYTPKISPYIKKRTTLKAIFDEIGFDAIAFDRKKVEKIDPYTKRTSPYKKY